MVHLSTHAAQCPGITSPVCFVSSALHLTCRHKSALSGASFICAIIYILEHDVSQDLCAALDQLDISVPASSLFFSPAL